MWEQLANHGARFRVSDWTLEMNACDGCLNLSASRAHDAPVTGRIQLVGMPLPSISESYVRGDELHLVLPQTDGCQVGLELALLVVEASSQQFVLESVIALQTLLLDLHPRVELKTNWKGTTSERWRMDPVNSSRWYNSDESTTEAGIQLAVLLDPRDRFSINESQAGTQRLSFFGDFMEKGVIRKVQPWWVWSHSGVDTAVRRQLADELSARPLPLTT